MKLATCAWGCLSLLLCLGPLLASPQDVTPSGQQRKVSVSVIEMDVVKPPPPSADSGVGNPFVGTHITCVIATPDRTLLALDPFASRLISFTDDQGTNLARVPFDGMDSATPPLANLSNWLFSGEALNARGYGWALDLYSRNAPASAAKELFLKARLIFIQGTDRRVVRQAVPLKVGSKISLGRIILTVSSLGPSKENPSERDISFAVEPPTAAIQSIRLLGSDGKPISLAGADTEYTNSSMTLADKIAVGLTATPASARVVVVYYAKLTPWPYSLNVKISAGL